MIRRWRLIVVVLLLRLVAHIDVGIRTETHCSRMRNGGVMHFGAQR